MDRRSFIACTAAATAALSVRRAGAEGQPFPFTPPTPEMPRIPERDFVISSFGAAAGRLNTDAIGRAIAACASAGGGRVVIPPGEWLTGPIHLKSRVNLHLAAGAALRFAPDPALYLPLVFTRWEGVECWNYSPLVYAIDCEDVAITGPGELDGGGAAWWSWKTKQQEAVTRLYGFEFNRTPVSERRFGTEADALRPQMVQFVNCRRVLLDGYLCRNTPFWTNHLVYCEDVLARNVRIDNPPWAFNSDGLNLDSCRNAIIRGLQVSTGDDAMCLKSGRDEDGWRVNRPCENVLVEGCRVAASHGGFIIGSEMSGGVRNVLVRDCVYRGSQRGVRIKSRPGRGGFVENIRLENLDMEDITFDAVTINMAYGFQSAPNLSNRPPAYRNFSLANIRCRGAGRALDLAGLPDSKFTGVSLANLDISARRGGRIIDCAGVTADNINVRPLVGPAFKIEDSREVRIERSKAPMGRVFVEVAGDSGGITLSGNDTRRARQVVRLGSGAPSNAAVIEK